MSLTTQGTDGAGRLLVLHALLSWWWYEAQQLQTPRNSSIVKPSQGFFFFVCFAVRVLSVKKREEAQEDEVGRGSVQALSLDDMILRKSGRRVSVQG